MPKAKPNKAHSEETPSLAKIVKAKGSLEEIEKLCSQGVAIDSKELSLKALKAYVKPLVNKKLNYKLLNTIELFELLANKQPITEQMKKPHYPKAFNQNGNCLAHELIAQGFEDDCITLLRKYSDDKIEALQKHKSIWHFAVRNNLQQLVEYLALKYPKCIDCLDEQKLTPWALAVIENKVEIARKLQDKGANVSVFVNEQGQTLLHKAVAESDMNLLNNCVNCDVHGYIVDSSGFTAHYYARISKNKEIAKLLKKLQFTNFADRADLSNSVIKNDSEALQLLLKDGVDPKKISAPTLLDLAMIFNSNKVVTILKEAGVGRSKSDDEIRKIRREKFGRTPNPLVASYAMEKLSLKKSEFKISPLLLLSVSLLIAIFTSFLASVAIAIGAGILSGLLYVAYVVKLHLTKVKEEKELKSSYKKSLDQKRVEVLKLAEQINTEKNVELLATLAKEIDEASQPSFGTTEAGNVKISGGKLLLIDKQIERLKKVEIEVPEAARANNRAKI